MLNSVLHLYKTFVYMNLLIENTLNTTANYTVSERCIIGRCIVVTKTVYSSKTTLVRNTAADVELSVSHSKTCEAKRTENNGGKNLFPKPLGMNIDTAKIVTEACCVQYRTRFFKKTRPLASSTQFPPI